MGDYTIDDLINRIKNSPFATTAYLVGSPEKIKEVFKYIKTNLSDKFSVTEFKLPMSHAETYLCENQFSRFPAPKVALFDASALEMNEVYDWVNLKQSFVENMLGLLRPSRAASSFILGVRMQPPRHLDISYFGDTAVYIE